MAPVAMAENTALLDPMHALTAGERTTLRKLYRHGPALSAGYHKGWMLGGTRYGEKAFNRFITLRLARCYRDAGKTRIALTYTGQLTAERCGASPADTLPPPSSSLDDD